MSLEKKDFFWPSYVDLMTGLFLIMLVLFVLSFKQFLDKTDDLEQQKRNTELALNVIKDIESTMKALPSKGGFFKYEEAYKRFALVRQIQFSSGSAVIPIADTSYLIDVGSLINKHIDSLKNITDKPELKKVKYLVIVEGMASNDGAPEEVNFPLSYERARSVTRLWQRKDLLSDTTICQLIVAGSGIGGVGRNPKLDVTDAANQRILIQIIPKVRVEEITEVRR